MKESSVMRITPVMAGQGERRSGVPHSNNFASPIHSQMKPRLLAWKNLSFHPLRRFHKFLDDMFSRLGKIVALHPSYFIIFPLFFAILGLTGFQSIRHEDDPELLFYPANGEAPKERQLIEKYFPMNFSSGFLPHHMTTVTGFARMLIRAKDNGNIFRQSIWNDLVSLDKKVKMIHIRFKDQDYRYKDLCAKWDGKCHENRVMNLEPLIPDIENGTFYVNYPIMLFPLIMPHDFGGLDVDENEGVIKKARSVSLNYFLKQDTQEEEDLALMWEQEFLDQIANYDLPSIHVSYFAARSRKDEMLNTTNSIRPFAAVAGLLMMFFSIGSVMAADWVRGKMFLGILGVASAGMATVAAFGYLMYLGVPFISINKIIPFLMIGIGIDDMFVVLASWRRTRIQDSVPKRLSQTYNEAGISVTITSLTNALSFSVGITTPILGVQIFCIYTTLSVLLTYLWHLTFFGGCLAIAGYLEQNQRHSMLCIIVKSKSEAEKEGSCCYSIWCAGGVSKDDPWNERDNRPHAIMVLFGDYLGKFLSFFSVKAAVIILFLIYLSGAIYGCTTLKEGLDRKNVVRHDSYAVDYYDMDEAQFRKFPYVIQVVITGDLNYSDPVTRGKILQLHDEFESSSFTAEKIFTQSWLRGWYRFVDTNSDIRKNITDENSFISLLRSKYLRGPSNPMSEDVAFNDDYSKIVASRITIQTYEITDTHKETAMVEEYRDIARRSDLNVTVFNPNFILFDQYTMVMPITIQSIIIAVVAMVMISLIFIPNPWCSLLVGIAIVSIETGVVGYMALWGVNLDQISMINLIMCIGFSVDFSAHISYAYLTAKAVTSEEKLRECLYSLGLPIIQGGSSTIVCIATFVLAPSYVYITFFKIVFLVVLFATLHGLLLIPVLLSIFGPGSKKQNLSNTEVKIPRVTLQPKSNQCDVEICDEAPKDKKEFIHIVKLPQENPTSTLTGNKTPSRSRPDPEGCSNRSFGKDSEKSDSKESKGQKQSKESKEAKELPEEVKDSNER